MPRRNLTAGVWSQWAGERMASTLTGGIQP